MAKRLNKIFQIIQKKNSKNNNKNKKYYVKKTVKVNNYLNMKKG